MDPSEMVNHRVLQRMDARFFWEGAGRDCMPATGDDDRERGDCCWFSGLVIVFAFRDRAVNIDEQSTMTHVRI